MIKEEMHDPIFGNSLAVLVTLILLSVLLLNFLNKKKPSVRRDVQDADTGVGSSIAPTKTKSNASSSSITPTGDRYHVFLSFRGPDTRDGFTSHLYNGLIKDGIRTFKDDNELRQGEEIGPDLSAAIKNSKILIPILSVSYGASKWCLDELVQIMECKRKNTGQIVLPIFYKVKPAHVRYQIGSFGEEFRMRFVPIDIPVLEFFRRIRNAFRVKSLRGFWRSVNPTILEKWMEALFKVGSLKGREAKGSEGELVKLVVQEVLSELKKDFELVIPKNLVGIDSRVKMVMEDVNKNPSATLFIGIYGMGGIGKTTLAKTIYNKLFDQFMDRCFIEDIRESCKRNGIVHLQNQLILKTLKHRDLVSNKDEGIKCISSMFKCKKVLILLDDVDDDDQLKALAENHNWFSSGSRILITTRNKEILDNAKVGYKYELEELDGNQSLIMFCRHAFERSSPPSEFKELTHVVVSTTGGLPLSLEVLGSLLHGKDPNFWKVTIHKLQKVPRRKVKKRLRISYEALDDKEKQIFLDIACFFIGTDGRIASYMWGARQFLLDEGIEKLRSMSLIKIGDNHELKMHDQLRDLGRDIICEENCDKPEHRSRLWDSNEVLEVLNKNKGTNEIKAIYLSKGSSQGSGEIANRGGDILTGKQFKKLTSLRFLHMSGAHFCGDFKNSIEDLRWLRWQISCTPFEAKNFHAKELVVLDLSRSEISNKWQGWSSIMMAMKLKSLDLTSCQSLTSTVFLSAFKNLEVLILQDCWKLEQIDSSIGDMKSLVRLDLTGCRMLKELPIEVGKLESLEHLLLEDCPNFSVVPDCIEALQNLEILNIRGTAIKELPNGIQRLSKLRDLDASRCKKLERAMPELPSSLTYLSITCQSGKLPSLSHLIHLKELHLLDCKFLVCIGELPSTLSELSECSQPIDVEESELQKSLNTPSKLEILDIRGCKSMEILDVSQVKNLRTLSAEYCNDIREVRGLAKLNYLESLTISWCNSIERLNLPKSGSLKILDVGYCINLVKIQGLNRLNYLEKLDIFECVLLERLNLPKSECLRILNVKNCKNLFKIHGLDRLKFLEKRDISGCPFQEIART